MDHIAGLEIVGNKVSMPLTAARAIAKKSGLKSKKIRKVMKRVKKVINEALRSYLEEHS